MDKKYLRYESYAIWYFEKYFPSRRKLKTKLETKFEGQITNENIQMIFDKLVDENLVINSKIRLFISRGKNKNYIISSLISKGFIREDIIHSLRTEFNMDESSLLDKNIIERKIKNLISRGKTKQYIINKFAERTEDRELVYTILDDLYTLDIEDENLLKAVEKNSKLAPEKLIRKLMSMGYNYNKIKKLINNN